MDNKKIFFLLISVTVISLCALGLSVYNSFKSSKITYVKSGELVERYEGIKEVRKKYQAKLNSWQGTLDSMVTRYQLHESDLEQAKSKMKQSDKEAAEYALEKEKSEIISLEERLKKQAVEEDANTTQGALNQVNSFIEEYAKRKGITVVLGVTKSGNILYGDQAIDITDDLIKELNANYKK